MKQREEEEDYSIRYDSSTTIHLGGVDKQAKEAEINAFFEQFGDIKKVDLKKKNPEDTKNIGWGFLVVSRPKTLEKILSKQFYKIGSRKVEFSRYLVQGRRRQKQLADKHKRRLYVKGIPKEANLTAAKRFFLKFGPIENIYFLSKEEDDEVVDAFLLFAKASSASRVAEEAKNGNLVYEGLVLAVERGKINIPKNSVYFPVLDEEGGQGAAVGQEKDQNEALRVFKKKSVIGLERSPKMLEETPRITIVAGSGQKHPLQTAGELKGLENLPKIENQLSRSGERGGEISEPKIQSEAVVEASSGGVSFKLPEKHEMLDDFGLEKFLFYKEFYLAEMQRRMLEKWRTRPSENDYWFELANKNGEDKNNLRFNITFVE